jgi:hypothetical protein
MKGQENSHVVWLTKSDGTQFFRTITREEL